MSKKRSTTATSGVRGAVDANDFEVGALRSTMYIPEHKWSVWVHPHDCGDFDSSKEQCAVWSAKYQLDKFKRTKEVAELWLFYDDDEKEVEESVLRNNPLQGAWGLTSSVEMKKLKGGAVLRPRKPPQPKDLVIIPPGGKVPSDVTLHGLWIHPVLKRDMSALDDGTAGFLKVSGQIGRAEKHSVGGAWKMLGHNDEISRGKKSKKDAAGDSAGKWTVNVRTVKGVVFPIKVIPGNKISYCKEQVLKEKGIPIDDQRLSFEGTPLQDVKTVVGSGIRNGDTIDLGPMEIFVRTHKGKKFKFEVDPDELVVNVKKIATEKVGMSVEEIRLFFKRLPMSDDSAPISKYKVKHRDVLDLARMVIFVEPLEGPTVELEVEPEDTILSVKTKVKNRIRIPVAEQRLFFHASELKDDKATLQQCGVKHLDTLTMRDDSEQGKPPPAKKSKSISSPSPPPSNEQMIIFIVQDWDNDKFQLQVEPSNKMLIVKQQIYQLRKIPVKSQILTFKKKPVKNSKTLEDSKVKHKSILHLEAKQIVIEFPNGEKLPIDTNPSDPVSTLPNYIQQAKGLPDPPDLEQLWQRNAPIDKNMPLDQLPDDEPIIVQPPPSKKAASPPKPPSKPGNVHVKPPKGKKFPLRVDPKTFDFPSFKDQVAKKINRPPRKFQLVNDDTGEPLDDSTIPVPGATYSIQDMPDPGQLSIRPPTGRDFHLLIDPEDTIQDIKRKASKPTGIPIRQLRLVDDDGDEPDDDEKPKKGKTYQIAPSQVIVQVANDPVHVNILPKDTIKDLLDRIADETGIPRHKTRYFVMDDDKELPSDETPVSNTLLEHGTPLVFREAPEVTIDLPFDGPNGRSFTLVIDPDDTIQDIKRKIAKPSGFPMRHIRLVDDEGIEAPDLERPRPGRTFHLDLPKLDVEFDGRHITVPIKPGDTVGDIKDRIAEAAPIGKSRVFFMDTENELEGDDTPIFQTSLGHGTQLQVRGPPEVTIDLPYDGPNGRRFTLIIDPDDSLGDIKKKLVKTSGIPLKHIRLLDDEGIEAPELERPWPGRAFHLDLPKLDVESDGWHITVPMKPGDTIGDIKSKIAEESGIPRHKTRIFFMDKDDELEGDDTPIFQTSVAHGTRLCAVPSEVKVEIPEGLNSRNFTLIIDPDDTVQDIKRKLVKPSGFPIQHLRLVDEDGIELPDLERPRPGRTFFLDPPKCEVELVGGKKHLFKLMPQHTVADLKDMVAEATGSPQARNRIFFFDGDQPLDDNASVFKAGIKNGTALQLRPPEKPAIEVRGPGGRSWNLIIDPDKPEHLKSELARFTGVPAKDLRVCLSNGEEIDEDFDLSRVSKGDVLTVDPKAVEIAQLNEDRFRLSILPSHTIGDLKDIIQEKTGKPKAKQRIFFLDSEGPELDNDTCIAESGFKLGDTFELREPEKIEIPFKAGGRSFVLFIDPEDSSEIEVQEPQKEKFKLAVLPTQTIADVKEMIEEQVGLARGSTARVFFMDAEGNALDDDTCIAESGFKLRDTFELREPEKIEIPFKAGGRSFVLFIDPEDSSEIEVQEPQKEKFKLAVLPTQTIADVKEMIEEQVGLARGSTARVFFMDAEGNALDEEVPFTKTELKEGSATKLRPLEKNASEVIFRSREGRSFVLVIEKEETVKEVKKKLREKTGLFVGGFTMGELDFDDVDEEEVFLDADPGIRQGTVLSVEPPSVQIEVPGMSKRIKVELLPTTTMKDIERVIEEQISEPKAKKAARQFFLDNFQELEENKPLVKQGFDGGVQLEVRAMQIEVKHWNGETITLDVETSEYIGDVKGKISKKFKIPEDQQFLSFNGEPVRDDATLKAIGVIPHSVLVLEPMQITVTDPNGSELSLVVSIGDTIATLKKMVSKKTKTPIDAQCIVSGSTEFTDTMTLSDCGVRHGDKLSMELFKVSVMNWYGDSISIRRLKPSSTGGDLKAKIEEETDLPTHLQRLKLDGVFVIDEETLEDQGIKHRAALVLEDPADVDLALPESEKMAPSKTFKTQKFKSDESEIWPVLPDWKKRIFFFDNDETLDSGLVQLTILHWNGDRFVLDGVPLGETVDQLKERIARTQDIRLSRETISFNGKRMVATRTLRQQLVQNNSVLVLEGKREKSIAIPDSDKVTAFEDGPLHAALLASSVELLVQHWNGDVYEIKAEQADYIDDVKETIFANTKIPIDQLRMTFKGEEVSDTENLKDQGIGHGATLVLEPMRIKMETPSGKTLSLKVELDDTIRDLKKKILRETGVSVNVQRIMFGGEEMKDSKTLEECGVEHLDEMTMEEYTVSVMHWQGDVFQLSEILPDDTIETVHAEILRLRHVPKKKQLLSYQGKQLGKNKTLEDEGIGHRATLILEEAPDESDRQAPRRKISFMSNLMAGSGKDDNPKLHLIIKHWNGRDNFVVESDPKEYVDDLRERILKERSIPIIDQHLSFQGKPLRDDANLETQVPNRATLQLDPMRVFVEIPDDSTISLEVEKDFTIRKLKQDLTDLGHVCGEEQVLVLGGEELQDGKTLGDYQIRHEETIALERFRISIMDETGVPFEITNVHPNDALSKLKHEILIHKSTPKDQQRLSYQGSVLSDKKTLRDHGIRHKSVIVLEELEPEPETPHSSKFKLSFRALPTLDSALSKRPPPIPDDLEEEDSSSSSEESATPAAKSRTFVAPDVPKSPPKSMIASPNGSANGNPTLKKKWWAKGSPAASPAPAASIAGKSTTDGASTKTPSDDKKSSRKITFQKPSNDDEETVPPSVGTGKGVEESKAKKKAKKKENDGDTKSKPSKTTKSSSGNSAKKSGSGEEGGDKAKKTIKKKKKDDGGADASKPKKKKSEVKAK